MKKKYIIITSLFPSSNSFRGSFIYDQVKAITKTGEYDVIVFNPKMNFSKEKDYEFQGVKVHRFRMVNLPSYILPGLFVFLTKYFFIKKIKELKINLEDVSIVHAHDTSIGFLLNFLKRKSSSILTVLHHHGFDVLNLDIGFFSKYSFNQKRIKQYGIEICNKVDLHVGVSKRTLYYLNSYEGLKVKNELVLYNGVDFSKFYPIENLTNKSYFTIGCIANFWPLKDQMTLLKAAKQLIADGMVDLRIIFIGSGSTLKECLDFMINNNMESYVEFRKELPHDDLVQFYNSIDLFVLPSYWEAYGCVYAESWACGTPFICVENQGISELLFEEDRKHWLIQKGEDKMLAFNINGYRIKTNKQLLNQDINIDTMVGFFLDTIKNNNFLNS